MSRLASRNGPVLHISNIYWSLNHRGLQECIFHTLTDLSNKFCQTRYYVCQTTLTIFMIKGTNKELSLLKETSEVS